MHRNPIDMLSIGGKTVLSMMLRPASSRGRQYYRYHQAQKKQQAQQQFG